MILINLETKKEYFLPLKKTSGEEQTTCPECSENRKKKSVKCFSFNHDKSCGRCGHCGISLVIKREFVPKKEYKKPVWKNNTQLSDKLVKWFNGRAISQETINYFKITEGLEWMPQAEKEVNTVQFNYFRNRELVNIKYRTSDKHFKMYKDAELVLYNLDAIKGAKIACIVEGEPDCMVIWQTVLKEVVSVPNGASGKTLEYIDNCIEYFDGVEEIVIATDDDLPGRALCEQLAERLGKERCTKMRFKGRKDPNEVLVKDGPQILIECYNEREEFPLEGVFTVEDYSNEINDIYVKGLPKGAKTQLSNLNKLINFHKGYATGITGVPSHGKSDALDQITLDLSITADWKGAFYSPENRPTSLHITKLARKLIGKPWWGENRISRDEIELAKNYLNDRFFFVKPEKNFTLDTILEHFNQLVSRKGIDFAVIDAWNKLEHKYGGDENKYIGESLDKISAFCELRNIHMFIVAHPRKMLKQKNGEFEVPNLYDINGSANWFNKLDNGICIYRDFDKEISRWYVQKVKFSHWGQTGYCEFKYEPGSGRFNEFDGKETVFNNNPWIHGIKTEPTPELKKQAAEHGIVLDDGSPNPLD